MRNGSGLANGLMRKQPTGTVRRTGSPWPEALTEEEFNPAFVNEIQGRLDRTPETHKVLLSINPLNIERNGLAPYRGETVAAPLATPWDTKEFADTAVQEAFLAYAERMIEYFKPDYLIIGIEVNLLVRNAPEKWDGYLTLHNAVYGGLKKNPPGFNAPDGSLLSRARSRIRALSHRPRAFQPLIFPASGSAS